jgi:2-succinyl-6-hydroxy-2,4-cyclohexadiene-1-carboxylate synthase
MNNLPTNNTQYNNITQKVYVNSIQSGQGAPVILIHGLAASLFDWIDLIPELNSAGYATYALDLLGHGKSGKPDSVTGYNIENVYSNFSDWIDSLQLDKPLVLIGHSLGGHLALRYTYSHPDRVCAIILCDPLYNINQLPLLLRLNYHYSIIDTTIIEHVPEWLIRSIVDLTSLSIRNGYELPEKVREQTAADYKRAQPGIFNILHKIEDLTPYLSSIKQPVLVLWGSHDSTLLASSFSKILIDMPNAKGGAIQGAGHVPHQSHAAIFNQEVLKFLDKLFTVNKKSTQPTKKDF